MNKVEYIGDYDGQAVQTDDSGNNVSYITVYLNELLALIMDMLRQSNIRLDPCLSSTSRTIDLFFVDIRENLESLAQPWTLRAMAERCGLGVTHFVHHCKQLTNMTPVQYLNHCRIEAAAKMLVEKPAMSITNIALTCGFGSSQYFATVFRNRYGCSPKNFWSTSQTTGP